MGNWNNYRYVDNTPKNIKLNYQLVDNEFPDNTETFQKLIENIFIVKETKFIQKRPGSKNRYIEISIPITCTTEEILNLGKRISIIEQRVISECKGFVENTVKKAITTQQLNNLSEIHDIIESHYENNFESIDNNIIVSIFDKLKKVLVNVKSRQKRLTTK